MSSLPSTHITIPSNVFDDMETFFVAPETNKLEHLINCYDIKLKHLQQTHQAIGESGELTESLSLLQRAGNDEAAYYGFGTLEKATKILDSEYWEKALGLTDVLDHMPASQRNKWKDDIENLNVPSFNKENAGQTLRDLIFCREQFFAERVDGLFRNLSGDHVTNSPEGFGKRMIISIGTRDRWGGTDIHYNMSEYLHDLRYIINKFLGRKIENGWTTRDILENIYKNGQTGEWLTIDGGAIRIKAFLKGTAHVEIHEDLSWRLNEILAQLHPMAIPPKFRKKVLKGKEYTLLKDLIDPEVLKVLAGYDHPFKKGDGIKRDYIRDYNSYDFKAGKDKHLVQQIDDIMLMCGGRKTGYCRYTFDYNFKEVLATIIRSGHLPDHVSHQYYPTPDDLAQKLVDMCQVEKGHKCLEPSAGQGNIATKLPVPLCIEVSSLFCDILKEKGLNAINTDFLSYNPVGQLFDRIIMNPPFSQGRALSHVKKACDLLDKDGILTAIVPTTTVSKLKDLRFSVETTPIQGDEFKGVSIDMCIVKMIKKEY